MIVGNMFYYQPGNNNLIMIEPVKFETAKLLKEKGFDEKPLHIKLNTEYIEGYDWDIEDEEDSLKVREFQFKDAICSHLYLRPTIGQVVMWLYEKHGIWIQGPFPYNNSKWGWVIFLLKEPLEGADGYKNVMSLHHEPYKFNSPTEAYEKAIEYVLSNLI